MTDTAKLIAQARTWTVHRYEALALCAALEAAEAERDREHEFARKLMFEDETVWVGELNKALNEQNTSLIERLIAAEAERDAAYQDAGNADLIASKVFESEREEMSRLLKAAEAERDAAKDLAASRLEGLSSAATRYESALRERDRAEAEIRRLWEALREMVEPDPDTDGYAELEAARAALAGSGE